MRQCRERLRRAGSFLHTEPSYEIDGLRIDVAPIDPRGVRYENFANALSFAADVESALPNQCSFHEFI